MKENGQLLDPTAFTSGKISHHSLGRRLDGPLSRSGNCEEEQIHAPAGNRTRIFERVAGRYTN
jgi:hypothetical protein